MYGVLLGYKPYIVAGVTLGRGREDHWQQVSGCAGKEGHKGSK